MKFVDESGRFASILNCPFGRRGSYFAVYSTGSEAFGRAYAYLATTHTTFDNRKKLFNLQPLYEGERVPFAIIMKPTELIFRTLYGDLRLCIAEEKLILIKGENGLGIRFASTTERLDRITKPRGKNAYETTFALLMATVIHPIVGNISANAPWVWDEMNCARSTIDLTADENGDLLVSVEEFSHSGYVRDEYPSYENALAAVTADWEDFCNNIPRLPGKYDVLRERGAWNLWSFIVSPSGHIKREMLYMSKGGPTSQWQLTFQSVAFAENTRAAWDMLNAPFDHQSETGQVPDVYNEHFGQFFATRPPIQGWALKMMKKFGYYKNIPLEDIHEFYPKLAAWADWFAKYRTDGVDGLPQYEHSDESGMEDGSTFRESCIMVTPDLPAYLVLLFEELAAMSEQLGMDDSVKTGWLEKAENIQNRLIEKLWDGEKFAAHTLEGKTIEKDYGILGYVPVILGKRLPDEIFNKLVSDLKQEGYILNDYGFDKEKIIARELNDAAQNGVRGFVYHPFNVILISGLYEAGEKEFASMVARRYCDAMVSVDNFAGNLNTFTGPVGGEWLSWTAGAYLIISRFTE